MSPEVFLVIAVIATVMGAYVVGYYTGRGLKTPVNIEDIDTYLRRQFPDEWAAYHRGVKEGYAQGIRDSQEQP